MRNWFVFACTTLMCVLWSSILQSRSNSQLLTIFFPLPLTLHLAVRFLAIHRCRLLTSKAQATRSLVMLRQPLSWVVQAWSCSQLASPTSTCRSTMSPTHSPMLPPPSTTFSSARCGWSMLVSWLSLTMQMAWRLAFGTNRLAGMATI